MNSKTFPDLLLNSPLDSTNIFADYYVALPNRPASQSPEPIPGDSVWDKNAENCSSFDFDPSTSTPVSEMENPNFSNMSALPIKLPLTVSSSETVIVGEKGRGIKIPRNETLQSPIETSTEPKLLVANKFKFRHGIGRGSPTKRPSLGGIGRGYPAPPILPSFNVSGQFSDQHSSLGSPEIYPPPLKFAGKDRETAADMTPNFCDNCFGKIIVYETNYPLQILRNGQNLQTNNDSDSGSSSGDLTAKNYHRELKQERKGFRYVDTHCHLDLVLNRFNNGPDYKILKAKYESSWSPNYGGCITDFCFPETYMNEKTNLWDTILANEDVWAAVGCHPHAANFYDDVVENFIIEKCRSPKVVAVGELGLDYSANNQVKKDVQKKILERQLNLGVRQLGKPLLLHCRDAAEDCFGIFKSKVPSDHPIHFHCFTYSAEVAEEWSNYYSNIYFGITPGIFTPRTSDQENFYRKVPLSRVLIETDAPYFLPAAYRRQMYGSLEFNHPGLGALVAIKLAEIRNETVENVFEQIISNTKKIYRINVD